LARLHHQAHAAKGLSLIVANVIEAIELASLNCRRCHKTPGSLSESLVTTLTRFRSGPVSHFGFISWSSLTTRQARLKLARLRRPARQASARRIHRRVDAAKSDSAASQLDMWPVTTFVGLAESVE